MNIWSFVLLILAIFGLFTAEVEAKAAKKSVATKKPVKATKAKKGKQVE
jgi:hypothetical protein